MSRNKFITFMAIGCVYLLQIAIPSFADNANPHGNIPNECQDCHSAESWTTLSLSMKFNHKLTEFPLEGSHSFVRCTECHKDLEFSQVEENCSDCHLDVHSDQFADDCQMCHNSASWIDEIEMRNMHMETRFPLIGAHAGLDCQLCHSSGRYADTPLECVDCHINSVEQTDNPDHFLAAFPLSCEECHNIAFRNWQPAEFTHPTDFPLVLGHAVADCKTCHETTYLGTPDFCFGCHQMDYNNALDPAHQKSDFSQSCEECHTIAAWTPAEFNHDLSTFHLTGAHLTVECSSCHTNGVYTGTKSECWDCHSVAYESTSNPIHTIDGYSVNCTDCHQTSSWQPAQFDHNLSNYPLSGAHVLANCSDCHQIGIYQGISDLCYSCHQQDYEEADDPDHVDSNLSQSCEGCHTNIAWQPSSFDHQLTAFPLTGSHIGTDCNACHLNGVFGGTPTDCYACHTEEFEEADDPDHVEGNFGTDCALCHNTNDWEPAGFNHELAGFTMDGAHQLLDCSSCHFDGSYSDTPNDCYSCHRLKYETVTDPNHQTGQYNFLCGECHTTTSWIPADFDHNLANFSLTGAHLRADCQACHRDRVYNGTPSDCYSCHEVNYNSTSNPDHEELAFSQDCAECHSTTAWTPAAFDHVGTDFPLEGAHRVTDCIECHVAGQFTETPDDCFFCHESDYNIADDPDHRGAGFPQDCEACHTAVNWDSDFNHDGLYFPIYTGKHRQEWNSCADCHTNSNDYSVFTCIDCHEHDRQEMDDKHDDVNEYRYESTACLECHPDGEEDMLPIRRIRKAN